MASAIKTALEIATDTSKSASDMLAELKAAKTAGKAVDDTIIASLEASIKNLGDLSSYAIKDETTIAGKIANKVTEDTVTKLTKDLEAVSSNAKKSVSVLADANPTDADLQLLKTNVGASADNISINTAKLPAKTPVEEVASDAAAASSKTGKINTKALMLAGGISAGTIGIMVANMNLVEGATFTIRSIDIVPPTVPPSVEYLIITYNTLSTSKDKQKKIRLSQGDTIDLKNLALYPDITGLDIYNPVYGDDTSTLMVLKSKMIPITQNVYICYDPTIKSGSVSCGPTASMISHTTFANEITQLFTNPGYVNDLISNDPTGATGFMSNLATTFGSTINAIMVMVLYGLFVIGILYLAYVIWKWKHPPTYTLQASSFGRAVKRKYR